ncbi:uncharacterized protein A9K55_002446 [Cordyceps militaris]|uniref:Uncharacterized protein n=1 Tax=Cordyceps militaris TaxID=73501 RepID=A0A2H4S5S8_CORMI|nr:uncharacterized protein A9K55_002446 [Cordyceps militaris]
MAITRRIKPADAIGLRDKLRDAYTRKNNNEIITFVKDHLKEPKRNAYLAEAQASSGRTAVAVTTPCIVFLMFGRFDYPTTQQDGTVKWTEINSAGFGYELDGGNEILLHMTTAVVILEAEI